VHSQKKGIGKIMAMTSLGYFLSVTTVDAANVPSTLEYELTAATIAAAVTDAAIIVAALLGVTNLNVKGQTISQRFYESTFTVGAGNAKVKGVVSGVIDGQPTKGATYSFPDPVDAILGAVGTRQYNDIDTADALTVAYSDVFQTGGQSKISDGEVLGAVTGGKRVTRGSLNP
jgi:hypothetical protein